MNNVPAGMQNMNRQKMQSQNQQQQSAMMQPPNMLNSFLNNSCVSEEKKEMIIKQIDELKYANKRDDALMALSQ